MNRRAPAAHPALHSHRHHKPLRTPAARPSSAIPFKAGQSDWDAFLRLAVVLALIGAASAVLHWAAQ